MVHEHQKAVETPHVPEQNERGYVALTVDFGAFFCDPHTAHFSATKPLTVTAINIHRAINWMNDVPRATTRRSHFAALAA